MIARSAKEARELGLPTYFTGKPCPKGHIAERRTANRRCVTCDKQDTNEYCKRRYQENVDVERAYRRQHYQQNRQSYIDASRRNAKPYVRKTEGIRDKSFQSGYWSAKVAEHRAKKKQRTPSWANLAEIEDFYNACPPGYEVDHIVPLNGKNVSGLHVLNNLQYLTRSANASKGNRHAT
jgi:hypothetical protein